MPKRPASALALILLICAGCQPGNPDFVNARAEAVSTPVYQINAGGGAVGTFSADQFVSGGATYATSNTVSTAAVVNAAPAAVYQTERYGNQVYTFPNLTPNAAYTVRLHFAEIWFTSAGQRRFNVLVNGTQVLTNLDIFAVAGGNKALVQDFAANASSAGQIVIQYVSVLENAKSSGIEILSSGVANQPPTVATVAKATPSPVTGTSTALSVLGADDGGEANLTYTWATTGSPPAAVSFAASGSNAAKNTTATFAAAGSYALSVVITDGNGASVTSNVSVTVSPSLSTISVTPTTAQLAPSTTQQFVATAHDQFGAAMAPPTFAWTASGGGTISTSGLFTAGTVAGGPFSVTASSGGKSGTATVTVTSGAPGGPIYQINSGGGAQPPFVADEFVSGGSVYASTGAVTTAGVANAAPAAVYQSELYGNFTYTLGSLTPNTSYTVRLHFAEIWFTGANQRIFNVLINGSAALSSFDIFAATGANKAVVRDFKATASSTGQIVVQYVSVVDNAKSSGIEVLATDGAPGNQPPTVATPGSATPNPITGKTTALSVIGADDGGEANLIYTWATSGTPPAPVSFSINGSNAAKDTTATFTRAGSYTLAVTLRDASGASVVGNVNVTVNQALGGIVVSPATAQVAPSSTQQFTARANDQFGNVMSPAPGITWTASGGGTISPSGLFTAGSTNGGPFAIGASNGNVSGSASVTIATGGGANDIAVNLNDVRQKIDGFGASDKYATLSDAQADLLFGQTTGIGLSILRVAVDTDGTDISPYANAKKAAARGAIVWAAPWSPPGEWKDNGTTGNGGHLLVANYDAWATRLAGFAATMQQNGVTLYGISAQNEPEYTASWNSCLYSPDQMIAFIKVLGPKLAALTPRPKLISPEASNWDALWGYGDAILQDSLASSYTDIIATHDYTYATPSHAPIAKPIWQTEVATFDGPNTDIGNGIMVAKWIHRALVNGSASAWHYWWLIGQSADNQGLINPGGVSTKRLYTVGNFSKFVRPGFQLVGLTGPLPAGVTVSAYTNAATGAIVIVAINENGSATPASFFVPGTHTATTPWVTSAGDDLAAKTAIAVAGGRFATTLAAQSVTTFVTP